MYIDSLPVGTKDIKIQQDKKSVLQREAPALKKKESEPKSIPLQTNVDVLKHIETKEAVNLFDAIEKRINGNGFFSLTALARRARKISKDGVVLENSAESVVMNKRC